jgi:hypothetical protein
MTNTSAINAGDHRRALALITHRQREFWGGVKAVLDEAVSARRETQLLLAVVDTFDDLVPLLRTEAAQSWCAQALQMIGEHGKPEWKRGAIVIMARALDDATQFDQAIAEANEDQPGTLFLSVLDIYNMLIPELATPAGLETLADWTNRLMAEEEQ